MPLPVTANHVTLFRMAAAPLAALLICLPGWPWALAAVLLFAAAALSDGLDGYLARKYRDTSLLGQVFDPLADKLLVIACLLALAATKRLEGGLIIPALAITLREIFVTGLREYVARNAEDPAPAPEDATLASTQLAKIKTVTQMAAIGILITAPDLLPDYVGLLGCFLLWVAAGLSLFTGYRYWQQSRFLAPKSGM